jgi:nitrite reductase/ring-hydroxylating ferredoxin subunit
MYPRFLARRMTWVGTGIALATFPPGSKRPLRLNETELVLVRLGEPVHAFAAHCPHEGGILADGELTASRLICPLHGAQFDAVSGQVLADPDGIEPPQGATESLARFPTRVVGGLLEVELPDSSQGRAVTP